MLLTAAVPERSDAEVRHYIYFVIALYKICTDTLMYFPLIQLSQDQK